MSGLSTEEEKEVLRRISDGDAEQFRLLVEDNQSRVFGFIFRSTGDRTLANDLTQDTFIRAYRSLRRFKGDSAFSTWVMRIAINVVHSFFASPRSREMKLWCSIDQLPDLPASTNPERTTATRQALLRFLELTAALRPKLREVVQLSVIEDLPAGEVARTLDIPIGTVQSRLHRGLATVVERLRREGFCE